MQFVDRTDETARLRKAISSPNPTLTIVYGRRRLGKSTLIKRVLGKSDIYFLADRSEGSHQRMLLAKMVAQVFPDFDKALYPDWESLFRAINYRAEARFSLCIDEFPYVAELSPGLPSVLQKLIDEKSLKYNVILCGSSQNMMYGLFLDSTAPLYGRADSIIRLSQIRPPYVAEALCLDPQTAIEEYAVWGGVPRYWELRETCADLSDALWQNVFSSNGVLYEEPVKLFQDDVKDIVKTATLMSYIGAGASRLSEIAARCAEPATNLSRPLRKLIDLGFLEREVPFGSDEKNAKKSLYKIAAPFMDFYYQFVVPNRSFIELGRRRPIEQALSVRFPAFVGRWWESLCRDAVTGNEFRGNCFARASRWWGSVLNAEGKPEAIELDVVAESIDKRTLLVGECKWTAPEDAARLAADLRRKAALLPAAKDHEVLPILFLRTAPAVPAQDCLTLLPADVLRLLGN